MIYIDRNRVPEPFLYSYKEHVEKHYSDPQNIKAQKECNYSFKNTKQSESYPGFVANLTRLFNNKCGFCESLLFDSLVRKMAGRIEGRWGAEARDSYGAYEPSEEDGQLMDNVRGLSNELFDRRMKNVNDPFMGEFFTRFHSKDLKESSDPVITTFRPSKWAADLYGRSSFEHYWWLEFEWNNYYLCCESCASQKGDRFPVRGERISKDKDTEEENALLIDPCRKKDFEEEDISFNGAQAIPLTEYGEVTIDVFGLNRPALIENRRFTLELAEGKISAFLNGDNGLLFKTGKLFSYGQPYLGAIISNARLNLSMEDFDRLMEVMPHQDGMEARKAKLKENAKVFTKKSLQQVSDKYYATSKSYSLDELVKDEKETESKDRLAYFRSSKWIGKVEIENFKNIKNLTLNFPRTITKNEVGKESLQPWLVLLGENGVGKSSVLQAVAMALMGQSRLNDFKFEAEEYVTRGIAKQSTVKIYLTDRPDPIVLTIDKEKNSFLLNVAEPQVVLMGYGATRLLTKDKERGFTKDFIRTKNLFDPFKQLDNVQNWLRDPKHVDDDLFEAISVSLSDLLMLRADKSGRRFFREKIEGKWQILFEKEKGEKIPLNFLSSGYKAVIALALDILVGLFQIYGEGNKRTRLQEAEGIALIDEIGVHLHPQWKMWIVGALRRTFPKMNFIATTHEPLCLRGLEKGEVFVVNLDEKNGIKVKTDLPSPKDLRVDQLLTSSFFGLNSVLDPEVERKFDRFYELQAMGDKITSEQKKEFDILRPQIMERKIMLGSTIKEEMEYKVIKEKFEHFSKEENKIKPEEVEAEIIEELKGKWDDVLF